MKNVKETQALIASTTSVEELEAMREGEQRKTVLDAITARIAELSDTGDAGDDDDNDAEQDNAPPLVKAKGDKAAAPAKQPTLQVKHPKASGKLGFKGTLYSRAEVQRNPALMREMYDAGCKAIIKA